MNEGKRNYKGFYVDVGAHHPYKISNTAFFYKKGWKGINIEANPRLLKNFQGIRKRDINLSAGVGLSNMPLKFYSFKHPEYSSFDEQLSKKRIDKGINIKEIIEIKPRKLSDILDSYLKQGQKNDFLSIDVEGFELDVLKSNDWDKYVPEFVIIEILNFENYTEDKAHKFLISKQYKLVAMTYRSFIYRL